jgi:class 3 adenylate cyclase
VRGSLHFGAVVIGEIGDTRRDIVFHGDVMNTAARLEEASRQRFRRICRVTVRPRETGSRRKRGPRKSGNVQPARET